MSDPLTPQDDDGLTYEQLRALAKELGRPLESMVALSVGNDPFTADMPRRREAAEWFAGFWRQFATDDSKLHIRRIHYRLISSTAPLVRPNGEPYINTEACWDWLCNAGRDARYLDLIPPGSIIDRRNPEPAIFLVDAEEAAINIAGGLNEGLVVPSFTTPRLYLVKPTITQRYLVEIWCEKSTINDILMPLGERYGVNVVTGVGEMSATRVEQLFERIRDSARSGRLVRILYISDFDPSGETMPVSVARKIEFSIRRGEWFDVQVRQIALTHDQCVAYHLPRTPIKETESRGEKWESRYGEGATELDALEAVRPGELHRLLVREIARYRDDTLDGRVADVAAEVQSDLDDLNKTMRRRHAKALAGVEAERKKLAAAIKAFRRKAEPVLRKIEKDFSAEAPDVDAYDWPEPKEGEEADDPLYDSNRDYLDQLARYREHQGKSEDAGFKLYDLICQNEKCQRPGRQFRSRRPDAQTCSKACRNSLYRQRGAKW